MTDFGYPHRHLRRTDSTNERARRLAETGAPSGTVVTADEQSAGRGRRGRVWSAPPGKALLYSAILCPLELEHALLPLSVPVAVCEAIEAVAPVECEVKWPNDVWIERRKVGGVLIEAHPPDWAVIGIGINVAIEPGELPSDLRWPATSVGHGVGVDAMRDGVSAALREWIDGDDGTVLEAFRARDALAGRAVAWQGAEAGDGCGTAAGVDERGNLVVETRDGARLWFGSGEISLRSA